MTIGRPLIRVNTWSREDARREIAAFWAEMSPIVVRAVETSLLAADQRHMTEREVRRRVGVAKNLVEEMRFDLGWSRPRIRDLLPRALSARLLGLTFSLDALAARSCW